MTVPLDNLYYYVSSVLEDPATFYLFFPHGTKKICDVVMLQNYNLDQIHLVPRVICHDQEPLNFDYYTDINPETQELYQEINQQFYDDIELERFLYIKDLNLRLPTVKHGLSIYDSPILLHSEINSDDLEKYRDSGFVDAYYWCHGILARDWYRFAEYDRRLDVRNIKNLF